MDVPQCGDLYSWGGDAELPTPNLDFRGTQLGNIAGGYGTTCSIGANLGFLQQNPKHKVLEDLLPANIVDVAFGSDHAIALTAEGKLFSWGSSKWGQVGLGAAPQNPLKPVMIKGGLSDKVVTSISCGSSHSTCLTSAGDVYTWGRGFEGQTGHASKALDDETNDVITSVQLLPKCVSAFVKWPVKVVTCGEKFTVCVLENGEVWSWGEGGSGQLGFGRVTKQAFPRMVMEKCPLTGEKFVGAAAGWGHTIAWTEGGEVWAWGLNAYGQLGLGDTKARYEPCHIGGEEDSEVKYTSVVCGGNYCIGIDSDNIAWSWGSNRSSQLGLGNVGEHQKAPAPIRALRGKKVSLVCATDKISMAYTPSQIYELNPPLGPISGGSKCRLVGGGFWASDNIVVRFIPPATSKKAVTRAAVGTFEEDLETGEQYVICKTPRFAQTGPVTVEVSMTGQAFTDNKQQYTYYPEPTVSRVTPGYVWSGGGELIELDGSNLFNSDRLKVRFKGKNSKGEIVVPGKFKTMVTGQEINEETEEMQDVIRKYIACKAPALEAGVALPWETKISVALNGIDFKSLEGGFIFHDFKIGGVEPRSSPYAGGVEVKIVGDSFFDSGKLIARMRWDHMEPVVAEEEGKEGGEGLDGGDMQAVEQVVWLPVRYGDKNNLYLDVLPLEGGDGSVKSLFDGPEPQWDSEAESLGVKIDLSIDGGESFLEDVVDFTYYREFEWEAVANLGGPMSGGTEMEFGTAVVTKVEASGDAAVRFYTDDGLFEKFSLAECMAVPVEEEERGEDGDECWRLKVVCKTPSFEVIEDDLGKGVGEEKSEEEKEGGGAGDGAEGEGVGEGEGEGEGKEEEKEGGEGEGEEGEEDAPPAKTVALTSKVLVEVAYNGVNFVENCGSFEFYPEPVVKGLSKGVVTKAGVGLAINGSGFFDSDAIKVKFENEGGSVCEVVDAKIVSRNVVSVVVPDLDGNDEGIGDGVGEEKEGEEEEEKKVGGIGGEGEEKEEEKEGGEGEEEEEGAWFGVSVSFNGTEFSGGLGVGFKWEGGKAGELAGDDDDEEED
ncbi:hypothetical protein TrVE_jg6442 [Triparma verrucosa]|uniref:RCC1-like domain-containing protein n=1 Tax=Triparma verrucosa TaxID=1606542 RepID=A0A9W7CII4_9STRA|nr:hypothetical protein TrVE_jg6442 [Triparma verrucosa]